jgi:excinuclease ABC subunit C
MATDYRQKLKDIPDKPGVYLMKDADGNVIYVGKASSLKKRVMSYFRSHTNLSPRVGRLVSSIYDIDYVMTGSEAESLLLEASIVKEYHPKYNVELKDDKRYPSLYLTTNEQYPRLTIARKRLKPYGIYFGPYTDAGLLRAALSDIRRMFPLRTCRLMPKSTCLNYHIGQCMAPCIGRVTPEVYGSLVKELVMFLKGRKRDLLGDLQKRMKKASEQLDFEEAARLRDRIQALSGVVGVLSAAGKAGRKRKADDGSSGGTPAGGENEYEGLRLLLGLRSVPRRIESFDISTIHGAESVGSMVSFFDGQPDKSQYRRLRIKTVGGIDDYGMIREVVGRRYKRLVEENSELPDLIVIDGGRGHVQSAVLKLKEFGLENIPVLGIAKRFEHIYLPDHVEPVVLARNSAVLNYLKRIRDEAHRFALSYHKVLRRRTVRSSELDDIEGIGEKRRAGLLKHFISVEDVGKATVEELIKVEGISRKTAQRIVEYFRETAPMQG